MDTIINKYKPYYIEDFHMNEEFSTILKVLINIDDLNLLLIIYYYLFIYTLKY